MSLIYSTSVLIIKNLADINYIILQVCWYFCKSIGLQQFSETTKSTHECCCSIKRCYTGNIIIDLIIDFILLVANFKLPCIYFLCLFSQFHAMTTLHNNLYGLSKALSQLVPSGGPVLCRDEMEEWSAGGISHNMYFIHSFVQFFIQLVQSLIIHSVTLNSSFQSVIINY